MNVLIGDIGNTITKICLIESKHFKIKKIVYFDSKYIYKKNFLKKKISKIIKKQKISNFSLFSSVVPKYYLILKKSLKSLYKINCLTKSDSALFAKDLWIKLKIASKSGAFASLIIPTQ